MWEYLFGKWAWTEWEMKLTRLAVPSPSFRFEHQLVGVRTLPLHLTSKDTHLIFVASHFPSIHSEDIKTMTRENRAAVDDLNKELKTLREL